MTTQNTNLIGRSTYRHGDLRRVLLEAGVALARQGGPGAVVLREATRQAGVVPNAAYRHFASHHELLQAVRVEALSTLAASMEQELRQIKKEKYKPDALARANLRAVGTGYLRFAHSEPGLFHTAFAFPPEGLPNELPSMSTASGLHPFQLLGNALDEFVLAGLLPAERRPGAEYLAWSAVHGLAVLFTDGPLRSATAAKRNVMGQNLLDMIEKGL